ncbi:MAG: ATP-binding protein [Finegoldia magna]|nr:ATP-binding protein [Finegoldia magna]
MQRTVQEVERAIIKKYRKHIWSKFIKAIKEYDLIQDGDKIAVCMSGGKDSLLLAKLFQELQKHGMNNFDLEFIAMNPGYSEENTRLEKANFEKLNIPYHMYDTDVFSVSEKISSNNPCYMCARMRRGALYSKAKELGCNKMALGHHFDDVIETILLNVLCSGNYKTMMPKLHSNNFEGIELIRPMYLIREESVKSWLNYSGLKALDCACSVTKKTEGSMRKQIKLLIAELSDRGFTNVENSIFKSSENVDVSRILGYEYNGEKHNFLDTYGENDL